MGKQGLTATGWFWSFFYKPGTHIAKDTAWKVFKYDPEKATCLDVLHAVRVVGGLRHIPRNDWNFSLKLQCNLHFCLSLLVPRFLIKTFF